MKVLPGVTLSSHATKAEETNDNCLTDLLTSWDAKHHLVCPHAVFEIKRSKKNVPESVKSGPVFKVKHISKAANEATSAVKWPSSTKLSVLGFAAERPA